MSSKLKTATEKVAGKIISVSQEDFLKAIEEHSQRDIATALLDLRAECIAIPFQPKRNKK